MTKWQGVITRTIETDPTPGRMVEQTNTSMHVEGELRRRDGHQASGDERQHGRILSLITGNTSKGDFIMRAVHNNGNPDTVDLTADVIPRPPIPPPRRRKPDLCAIYGPFAENGTIADNFGWALPANSCAGTLIVSCTEADGGRGDPYGYTFVYDVDGVNAGTTGCISADGRAFAIPAGAVSVDVGVTGGCAGGLVPGRWFARLTSP